MLSGERKGGKRNHHHHVDWFRSTKKRKGEKVDHGQRCHVWLCVCVSVVVFWEVRWKQVMIWLKCCKHNRFPRALAAEPQRFWQWRRGGVGRWRRLSKKEGRGHGRGKTVAANIFIACVMSAVWCCWCSWWWLLCCATWVTSTRVRINNSFCLSWFFPRAPSAFHTEH